MRKPIQVILIEHDEAEAAAIMRASTQAGLACQITHFPDVHQAWVTLRGRFGHALLSKAFLIVLDLDLPDRSGFAFLDDLRADPILRRSIVFVMSTSVADEDKAAAYDRAIAGYLVKRTHTDDYAGLCELLDIYERSVQFALT